MKSFTTINRRANIAAVFVLFFTPIFAMAGNWGNLPRFPAGITDGTFNFVINGKAYVGSGLAGTHFYEFDPAGTGTWKDLGTLPNNLPRIWSFAFEHNGKGYVGGGSISDASTLTDTFYEYDPATNTWTKKASFGGGKRDAAAYFAIGDKAYVGGGFNGQIVGDFWEYDFTTDKWSQIGFLPCGVAIFPSGFALNGKGYITGGQGNVEYKEVYEFDPATKQWTQKKDFPGLARQAGCAFVMGDKAYFGAGMSDYTVTFSDFWEYDAAADSWTKLEKEAPTTYTAWATAFAIGTTAYFGGGASFDGGSLNFSDTFYTISGLTTGVNEGNLPSPTGATVRAGNNVLTITTEQFPALGLDIFDVCGNTILTTPLGAIIGEQSIPLAGLPAGIYAYRLRLQQGSEQSGVFSR